MKDEFEDSFESTKCFSEWFWQFALLTLNCSNLASGVLLPSGDSFIQFQWIFWNYFDFASFFYGSSPLGQIILITQLTTKTETVSIRRRWDTKCDGMWWRRWFPLSRGFEVKKSKLCKRILAKERVRKVWRKVKDSESWMVSNFSLQILWNVGTHTVVKCLLHFQVTLNYVWTLCRWFMK